MNGGGSRPNSGGSRPTAAADADRRPNDAERLVVARVRAAAPSNVCVRANVPWVAPTREGGPARDGEIDVLLVDPVAGLLLAIEVKGGVVSRDSEGRWFAGERHLDESPFHQADAGARVIAAKIAADPRWHGDPPRPVHAVAFPQTDRPTLDGRPRDLGPDAPAALILDEADLADDDATRRALARVIRYWTGDGARDRPLSAGQTDLIEEILEPDIVLRPLLGSRLAEGERDLLAPTARQLAVLKTLRRERRASIVGGAGSGKTILAAAKARALAADGFNVLLVCFNQPLARALADDPAAAPLIADGRLTATTFHELCRSLAARAGVLPPMPTPPGRAVVRGDAAARARSRDPDGRRPLAGDRRRRGPGLRRVVAGIPRPPARGARRGRVLPLPRPRAGASTGRTRQPRSGSTSTPSPTTAATRGPSTTSPTAGTPATSMSNRFATMAWRPNPSKPPPARTPSRRFGRSSTGWSTPRRSSASRSPC